MKRPMTRREKLIFLICCCMIGLFLVYNLVWRSFRENVDGIDAQVSVAAAQLKKIRRTVADARPYEQRYAAYQKSLSQQGTDEAVVSRLLSEIEQVSTQTGLKVSDLKPLRIRDEKFYRMFPVSVMVDGTLVTTLEFIDVLQKEPHRFDVLDLRIDQTQRKGEEIKSRVVMGKIFFKEASSKDEKKAK